MNTAESNLDRDAVHVQSVLEQMRRFWKEHVLVSTTPYREARS